MSATPQQKKLRVLMMLGERDLFGYSSRVPLGDRPEAARPVRRLRLHRTQRRAAPAGRRLEQVEKV
jgi:hypothetical protein